MAEGRSATPFIGGGRPSAALRSGNESGQIRRRGARMGSRAFTMVEVLVVLVISVILFGLLMKPLIDALRYTKDAQLAAAAQDDGRKTMEILTREIEGAAYVYDNTTHAFDDINGSPATQALPGVQIMQYTNFLDLQVPTVDPNNPTNVVPLTYTSTGFTGTLQLAHAYDAKLDLVLPRHTSIGSLVDPTAGGQPVVLATTGLAPAPTVTGEPPQPAPAPALTPTPYTVPIAPGTSMVRYFIGLRNPDEPYVNAEDHVNWQNSGPDNTYVLYRAEFSPYNADGSVNGNLFATDPSTGQPILDDPDFFRQVYAGTDVNWLDPAHIAYGTSEASAHNTRYENWKEIAKPLMTEPEIDLLLLPHNPDHTIDWDAPGATTYQSFPGVAHWGADFDPVPKNGVPYPIVRTSITFAPGVGSSSPAAGTTEDDPTAGVGAGTNAETGLPYIPTMYQSVGQTWIRPYTVFLYPVSGSGYYFITQATHSVPDSSNTALNQVNAGDVVEFYHVGSSSPDPDTDQALYDVTSPVYPPGTPGVSGSDSYYEDPFILTGGSTYTGAYAIPCSINEDTGTIDFSEPALPNPGWNRTSGSSQFAREYVYVPSAPGTGLTYSTGGAFTYLNSTAEVLALTQTDSNGGISWLNNYGTTTQPYPLYSFIVPGSLRVYGPDNTPGPNYGQRTLYTPVSPEATPSGNQYCPDYYNNQITLDPNAVLLAANNAQTLKTTPTSTVFGQFSVIYNYQANMQPQTVTMPITSSTATTPNPAYPLGVQVQYHDRAVVTVNIGIRYFDSFDNAQAVVLNSAVNVGNINR